MVAEHDPVHRSPKSQLAVAERLIRPDTRPLHWRERFPQAVRDVDLLRGIAFFFALRLYEASRSSRQLNA